MSVKCDTLNRDFVTLAKTTPPRDVLGISSSPWTINLAGRTCRYAHKR